MSQLQPKATPLAKSSATKAVPTSSSRLQTGCPSLGRQQQQAQKQQRENHHTTPLKESQQTLKSDLSRGSNGGEGEDPSDPLVVTYEGPDRFYSFAEKEKMWDWIMKNVKPAGAKKPVVKL